MSLTDDTARYYAARAQCYDQTAGYESPEAERLREPIKARFRKLFAGHDVLEVACGTGYWTSVIAETASVVVAVDSDAGMLELAKERCQAQANVSFRMADAYALDDIPNGFTAAFAHWWWSHVPRERLSAFLVDLHAKLRVGALVVFVDQLPYTGHVRRQNAAGDTLEQRELPGGRAYEIVKNFPTEQEVRDVLAPVARDVRFTSRRDEMSWTVIYHTKPHSKGDDV